MFENVELPLTYRGMRAAERKERCNAALERVGMAHRAKHLPSQLSGGQQQRVAVARAVVGDPLILLADEPTGNLDSKNGEMVMDLMRELHRGGATICMVTHDPRYAAHADRSIHLFDGRVVEENSEVAHLASSAASAAPRRAAARRGARSGAPPMRAAQETLMSSGLQDLRFGARLLLRAPAFTLVAVASLALGIGANTAIFGAINGLLLKPLPVAAPDRLVAIFTSDFSGPHLRRVVVRRRRGLRARGAGARAAWPRPRIDAASASPIGTQPERVFAELDQPELLRRPRARGRCRPAARAAALTDAHAIAPAVVITHRFWQRRFGGDPAVDRPRDPDRPRRGDDRRRRGPRATPA